MEFALVLSGVELVVSDDHEGLKAAVARHFQGASHHKCQIHYLRNLLGRVEATKRKELTADLYRVFAAPYRLSSPKARRAGYWAAEKWRGKGCPVAEHMKEHIEQCLSGLSFPES